MDTTRLATLTRQLDETTDQLARLREKRDAEIVKLARAGTPQSQLAEITGLSRETLRKIERAAGVVRRQAWPAIDGE